MKIRSYCAPELQYFQILINDNGGGQNRSIKALSAFLVTSCATSCASVLELSGDGTEGKTVKPPFSEECRCARTVFEIALIFVLRRQRGWRTVQCFPRCQEEENHLF